jgi:putative glutamine amidotransferase
MGNSKFLIFSLLVLLFLLNSCDSDKHKITIALSKANNLESSTYVKWIKNVNSDIEFINMYTLGVDSALKVLDNCSGLLVTGGEDVNPAWYGQISDTITCEEIDYYRDTLEISLIRKAVEKKMPVFGVCRGEQIINVALGGSLFTDIPSQVDSSITHRNNSWNCYHNVNLVENTLLSELTTNENTKVNSYHHQAIDRIAIDLTVTSYSDNNTVESVEWKINKNKGFLMAVQWHPERLDSVNNNLSLPIVKEFISEIEKYYLIK